MTDETKKLCFVVGPIGAEGSPERDHADLLLDLIIDPVMRDFPDYSVVRQDKDSKPGMIDTQIIVALRDAALVIADLSHLNPNAFYEIGIRHMVEKPIIHMQLDDQRIPFDLSLYKTVMFSFKNLKTYQKARTELAAQVKEAVADGYEVDNPVTRALGQAKFKQHALPELKILEGQMASMQAVIENLQQQFDANRQLTNMNLGVPPIGSLLGLSNLGSAARFAERHTILEQAITEAERHPTRGQSPLERAIIASGRVANLYGEPSLPEILAAQAAKSIVE